METPISPTFFYWKTKIICGNPNFPKFRLETPNFPLETPNSPMETPNFPLEIPNSPWKPHILPHFYWKTQIICGNPEFRKKSIRNPKFKKQMIGNPKFSMETQIFPRFILETPNYLWKP